MTSSITMGGIGIWAMHFVGNLAVILDGGDEASQIRYSSRFTAVSFFLPIVVLLGAFYLLGVTERAGRYYITLSGFWAGTAICGMHYLGDLGVANYHCVYRVQNVAGAAIIAVIASVIALGVFFHLREVWTDSWWKRSFCGSILACAVSGMHWTAGVGTFYEPKPGAAVVPSQLSRTQTVIICAALVSLPLVQ